MFSIELELDRLGKSVEEDFDVAAVGRRLAVRELNPGAQDASLPGVVLAFLRPVDLSPFGIDGDPNAPSGLVVAVVFARSSLDEGFDLRTVEIRAHDSQAFAIGPVELAVRLIEMELLRRECAAGCNDEPAIASIDVGAFDGAVVPAGNGPHIGPVDVTRFHVHDDPVGMGTAGRDDLGMRAVRIHRQDAAAAQVEKEQPTGAGRVRCGFGLGGLKYGHGLSSCVGTPAARYSAACGFGRLLKLGSRFSRNAVKASIASAECTRAVNSRPSDFAASLSWPIQACLISRLEAQSAPDGFAASFCAVAVAVASRSRSGTTRVTRPSSAARAAVKRSPSRNSSAARRCPTRAGIERLEPNSGTSARSMNGSLNFALSPA